MQLTVTVWLYAISIRMAGVDPHSITSVLAHEADMEEDTPNAEEGLQQPATDEEWALVPPSTSLAALPNPAPTPGWCAIVRWLAAAANSHSDKPSMIKRYICCSHILCTNHFSLRRQPQLPRLCLQDGCSTHGRDSCTLARNYGTG